LEPGVYVLRASVPGTDPYDVVPATQWFLVSDLGVTSLAGADGLHVIVQRLSDGRPAEGLRLQLVARSNRALGESVTDAQGHATFAAGLSRGGGNAPPALVLAEGEDDLALRSLEEPQSDLSDRGVEGRVSPGPIDVFLSTDRGAYRPGETIHLTALVRDTGARAIAGLPITARLLRPDGMEVTRVVSDGGLAGGHLFAFPLGNDLPRGVWRIETYADPDDPPLASRTVLVEDFLPERIDFELSLESDAVTGDAITGDAAQDAVSGDAAQDAVSGGAAQAAFAGPPVDVSAPPDLRIDARYLFGAPGAGLSLSGGLAVATTTELQGWPGYQFGRHDQRIDTQRRFFEPAWATDAQGHLEVPLPLDGLELDARPYALTIQATLVDGSSRPVERDLTRALRPIGPVVGIRPGFDGALPENAEA